MNPKFVFVFDSLCSWCYAFHPELEKILSYFSSYGLQNVSGGMFVQEPPKRALDFVTPENVHEFYKRVIDFGKAEISNKYMNGLIVEQNYKLDSMRTSKGIMVFRSFVSDTMQELKFIHATQTNMYVHGMDPNSDEYYTSILADFGIDSNHFLEKMTQDLYKNAAIEDMQYALQLEVKGYPHLFLQTSRDQYYLIAQGYSKAEDVISRVNSILEDMARNN